MLESFFEPRSVAVVGASREEGKVGHDVLRNLIQYEFQGEIYPINPKADEIMGLKCYPSVSSVPGDVDLVVLVIPAKIAIPVLEDCAKKKVKAVIIITAGFKEVGREGADLERQVVEIAHKNGMRIVGPNCLGLISTPSNLNASFADGMPEKGGIAFLSQSGAFGTAVLDWAIGEKIGFSKFISVGNKADVDETDLIRAIGDDAESKVLLGYIESVENGPAFMKTVREVTKKKPIIMFKSGGTEAGARAASSHTGALAGSDKAYDAAFRQVGVLRARKVVDLFDWGLAFSSQGRIKGPNVGLVTNAGGPGIIATDAIEESDLKMATLAKETIESLRAPLPPTANLYNPVDVIGDAKADRYEVAIRGVLKDPNVDGLIVILTPQTSTEPELTAELIVKAAQSTDKPVLACYMGGPRVAPGAKILMQNGVPVYPFPERAVMAMDAMYRQQKWMETPASDTPAFDVAKDKVARVFQSVRDSGRLELGELEAREVVEAYGFRLPKSVLVKSAEEAAAAAHTVGLPCVMKISSPDILHKSDIGGVKVGLKTEEDVVSTYSDMVDSISRKKPDALIEGVLVQEMVSGGKEIILGMMRDPQFGPMLMFGLGGIYVEVLKDVAFRIAPLTRADAETMIEEIRSVALLKGARGEAPADLDAVVDGLLKLSQLVSDFPEIVELDVNPLLVFGKGEGAIALDARLTLNDG
jgi:acetate---CoA ligase (ADP-forming)